MTSSHIFRFSILSGIILLYACGNTRKTFDPQVGNRTEKVEMRPVYHASETKYFQLINTEMHLSPDFASQAMSGLATITLSPYSRKSNRLILDARSMEINEVGIIKGDSWSELGYSYSGDSLTVFLDRFYSPADTVMIQIDYVSFPERQHEDGSRAITSEKGLFFINHDGSDPDKPVQLWTQGETRNNSVWFPTIDHPNQKMTQDIYLTVDTSFVTLSNGKLISSIINVSNGTRTDYWKQSLPHAPYLAMIAVGKYSKVSDTWNGIDVDYYVEPEYEPYARDIFRNTTEMLTFFSEEFGIGYPWEKYSQIVVRDFVSGAMENTTAVVYGEFVQQDEREQLDRNYEEIVAHELTHHWFGDLVTCESWANIPLNEAFATYGEYLWFEYKYGRDFADHTLRKDLEHYLREAQRKKVNFIRFDYDEPEDMYDRHSYQKGSRILHMLRSYTGDEAFFRSLNLYLRTNKFGAAEVHDLRLAFEKVTGEDLNWFFNQWFLDAGHPVLKVSSQYDETDLVVELNVKQLQDRTTAPLYKIPLSIDIYSETGVARHEILIDKSQETFRFNMESKPLLVNFDAKKMLLCEKFENKTSAEYIYQYYNAPLYMDRFEAVSELGPKVEKNAQVFTVLIDALHDTSPDIREEVINHSEGLLKADRETALNAFADLLTTETDHGVKYAVIEALLNDHLRGHPDHVISQIRGLTGDRSYEVQRVAYEYLLGHDSETWIKNLEQFESSKNSNEQSIAVYLYGIYGSDEQFEFMTGKLKDVSGRAFYYDVESYGKFLLNCSPSNALKGTRVIGALGIDNDSWSARLGAYRALLNLSVNYHYGERGGSGPESERNSMLTQKVRKLADEQLNVLRAREQNAYLKRVFAN